jgi:hypothetical protein
MPDRTLEGVEMRKYKYSDDLWSIEGTCDRCGWSGTLGSTRSPYYDDHFDPYKVVCPDCGRLLATIPRETREEKLARDPYAIYESLPEPEGEEMIVVFDLEHNDGNPRYVLRCGEAIISTALARWEDVSPFESEYRMLRAHYGNRLVDLVPTNAAVGYLCGDDRSAMSELDRIREKPPPIVQRVYYVDTTEQTPSFYKTESGGDRSGDFRLAPTGWVPDTARRIADAYVGIDTDLEQVEQSEAIHIASKAGISKRWFD